jgi:GNAT superfamily N-acetyltransferase
MRIDVVPYDHPDATRLIERVQRDYVTRYGGEDDTPVDPAEFAPPGGLFLVCYLGGVPVACGGWRGHRGGDRAAEVKRMYVLPLHRRQGLARALLAELERTARAAGRRRIILETGSRQPEALALYRAAGYTPVARFGRYADAPGAVHLGKVLEAEMITDPMRGC